jgi:hypothetical protein
MSSSRLKLASRVVRNGWDRAAAPAASLGYLASAATERGMDQRLGPLGSSARMAHGKH